MTAYTFTQSSHRAAVWPALHHQDEQEGQSPGGRLL